MNRIFMKIYKNNVAIISDIHLGLHQANNMWHKISLDYAAWLRDQLHSKNIKDILVLGDIFDNRNEVAVPTLHLAYNFFKILEDFNIIMITGNHDCYYSKRTDVHSIATLDDWSNIKVIDKLLSVNLFGKTLTFCPWSTSIDDMPPSDIIFGHFEINSFKMNGSHMCEHGINAQELLKKSSLILTGHFHNTEDRQYKNGRVIYVGSPYQQNWGESNEPKGFYILDIQNSAIDFIPNDFSPRHIKIKLSELIAVGKITDNLKKEFEGNIVNFIIDKEIDQDKVDKLLSKLYSLKPLSIKSENILFKTNIISSEEEISFEGIDIKHDIIQYINELEEVENKAELINYLTEVYDTCIKEK